MKVLAFYFSGTGNTAFVMQEMKRKFATLKIDMEIINIEAYTEEDVQKIIDADRLIFAYPVYGSMSPMIMWRFVRNIGEHLNQKKTAVIATQLMASGDGGAYLARVLRRSHADIFSIEHFNMPSNLVDVKLFKVKNGEENREKVEKTLRKMDAYCNAFATGKFKKTGDGVGSMFLGALQRNPFSKMERKLSKKIHLHQSRCIGCEKCVTACPTQNLFYEIGQLNQKGDCTLCYRCVNLCPQKAISILSKKPPEKQYEGLEGQFK